MTKQEIAEITTYLCLAYNREVTKELLELMLRDFGYMDCDLFSKAVEAHRSDPQRGTFYPTKADIMFQTEGDRREAQTWAGIEFDKNPNIDGSSKFDTDRETYDQRDRRRRAYVQRCAYEWEGQRLGHHKGEKMERVGNLINASGLFARIPSE